MIKGGMVFFYFFLFTVCEYIGSYSGNEKTWMIVFFSVVLLHVILFMISFMSIIFIYTFNKKGA